MIPATLLSALLLSPPALALPDAPPVAQEEEDDDWIFDEDDETVPDERERKEEGAEEEEERDRNGYYLDEEEEGTQEARAGQDTAEVYRSFQKKVSLYEPEEELAAWEEYLSQYPFSVFQQQIEARMDELSDKVYSERISGPGGEEGDAMRQELNLAVPLLLESIDPRTKLRVGFEWGFPAYLNLVLDGEYQILRELSAHGGIRRRYTGWNVEAGVKYSTIKSTRTGTVVSGLLDFHVNTNPVFPALRPQLGVGQVLDVGGGLHLQAQGGIDVEFWSDPGPQIRYIGGANVYYQAADNVGVFAETSTNMKFWEEVGSFRFNIITFGLRFAPGKAPAQIGVSANVPYSTNYWSYHYGAVQGDVNYFLD